MVAGEGEVGSGSPVVGVLGPTHVMDADGVRIDVPSAMQRRVLCFLAHEVGQLVSTDRLVDAVWAGRAPKTARSSLQMHISGLRRILDERIESGSDLIETIPGGYRLAIDADRVDVAVLERALDDARALVAAGAVDEGERSFTAALDRWGPPFQDLQDDHLVLPAVVRLNEVRHAALDDWFELRSREPSPSLVAELESRVVEVPDRTRPWVQLVDALLAVGADRRAQQVAAEAPVPIDVSARRGAAGPEPSASTLSGESARVLAELALLGLEPDVDFHCRALDRCPEVVVSALDDGVRTGAITRTATGDRFVDEETVDRLAATLPTTARLRVHDAYAAACASFVDSEGFVYLPTRERRPHLDRLASHAHASLPIGAVDRAVSASLAAGELAALDSAWRDATRHFERSMRALSNEAAASPDRGGSVPDAARLRYETSIRLGTSLVRSGETRRGSEVLREAIDVARSVGDDRGFAEAVRRYVEHLPPPASAGDPLVRPLIDEALRRSAAQPDETHVQLLIDRATSVHLTEPLAVRERLATEAIEVAERLGEPRAIGLSITGRLGATWAPSTARRRMDDAVRAQQVAAEAGVQSTDTAMTGLVAELVTSLELGDRERFDRSLRRGIERCDELEQAPRIHWWFRSWQTIQLALDGDLAGAATDGDAALAESPGAAFEAFIALMSQRVVLAVLGQPIDGFGDALAAVSVGDAGSEVLASLAVVRAIEGDLDAARRAHRRAATDFDPSAENMGTACGLALLADSAWRLGDPSAVLHLVDPIEALGSHHAVASIYGGGGLVLGPLAHAAAQLCLLTDRPAERWIEQAVEEAERLRAPLFVERSAALAAV